MDRAKLEALEKLLAKATPGPWQAKDPYLWDEIIGDIDGPDDGEMHYELVTDITNHHDRSRANAALIVAAVNALPALLRLARAVADAPEVSFYADCNMIGVIGPDWADEKSLLQGTYLLLRADAADTTAGEGNA